MTSNLEGLIAKGRRVTHVREQREVAFGLADLSTRSELHERIVQKGGIKTLIHILNHSRDVEAQRFAALAIANTASSDTVRVNIAQEDKVVFCLLEHIKDDKNDEITRQYCAMVIGNLAVNREIHSIIVDSSGISILVELLRLGANDQNDETTQHAAFALSNLASNDICSKEMVDTGALNHLILAACFDDTNVRRHSLTALRGICNNSHYHSEAISVGLLDPLILLARSPEIGLFRNVAVLFHCLSSTVGIRKTLSDRAASTIAHLSISDDILTRRHATCAIANLTEIPEIQSKLVDENVLDTLEAIISSTDLSSKGQACRAFANLSSNMDLQSILLEEGIIEALVNALDEDELNCQRFSSLCLANLARTVKAQTTVAQMGSICRLNNIVSDVTRHLDARKYACLAIANLSATKVNHRLLIKEESLGAILSLSHSDDIQSKYYVSVALSNLGSNVDNHSIMVEEGCIQPLISLLFDKDVCVHKLACAALHGLSFSDNFRIKIIQEGGLEPLNDLLQSNDVLLLREACSCLSNISSNNEGKMEMVNFGMIKPLVTILQHDDPYISSCCAAALANLAEMHSNKDIIASFGAIKPSISVMISQHLEAQREGGRLLANLCSCDSKSAIDLIFECGGHHLLTSYLLSRDVYSQQIGAFGICCLCFHEQHRLTLIDTCVLEPLSLLVESNETSIVLKRFALLAMVYLSSESETHHAFLNANICNTAVSPSVSTNAYIRIYSALVVANLGRNMKLTKLLSNEGGLEPILYLARVENMITRREALPAIANLSFIPEHRDDICSYGGLFSILQELKEEKSSLLRYACCAIANLSEQPNHAVTIVEAGVLDFLTNIAILSQYDALHEAARALGNLATNISYSKSILSQHHVLHSLFNIIQSSVIDNRRMAMMALSNLSANTKCHKSIMEMGIVEVVSEELQKSLDYKRQSDHQTTRILLLLVSNLCANKSNGEKIMISILDYLVKFSNHRDIKCRQNATIAIGNLCSNEKNVSILKNTRVPTVLISQAFPSIENDSSNAHLQAIAGLRGLATVECMRYPLVESGCCESLTLSLCSHDLVDDVIRCETAAAVYNLTLSTQSSVSIVKSGIVSALIASLDRFDTVSKIFGIGILANLAEKGDDVQYKLVNNGCIAILSELLIDFNSSEEIKLEIVRCFALLASNVGLHDMLLTSILLNGLITIVSSEVLGNDCKAFATLTIANLASSIDTHGTLMEFGVLSSMSSLHHIDDHRLRLSLAFLFHNVAKNIGAHQFSQDNNVVCVLSTLIASEDELCKLHTCLAVRYFSISECIGQNFIDTGGIPSLLQVLQSSSIEHKREVAGALRNLSISKLNKQSLLERSCVTALLDISRCSDRILAQQSFATLANLAEETSNRMKMIEQGILQHLKYALTFRFDQVRQESLRAISNLSNDISCVRAIEDAGLPISIMDILSSNEVSSHIFAAMTISNLTTYEGTRELLIREGCITPLFHLYTTANELVQDESPVHYCFTALSNLSASTGVHEILINCEIVQICCSILEDEFNHLTKAALSCLANLASKPKNHSALQVTRSVAIVLEILDCVEEAHLYHALLFLRGLSTSPIPRNILLKQNTISRLWNLVKIKKIGIRHEVLHTLCNLSVDDDFHNHMAICLTKLQADEIAILLQEDRYPSKLFGTILLGNGFTNVDFRERILDLRTLDLLIHEFKNGCHYELGRCIAYCFCNISKQFDHGLHLVRSGGLIPILLLTRSNLEKDVYNALSPIRAICMYKILATVIMENNSLEYLLDVSIRNISKRCTIEALEAIYLLSLHNQYKSKIVQHELSESVMKLSCISVQFATLLTAVLASCSEMTILNSWVIGHVPSITLSHQVQNISYYKQYTRLASNLCANKESSVLLLSSVSAEKLLECATFENDIVQKNLLQILYNICIHDSLHHQIQPLVRKLTPRLIQYITLRDHFGSDVLLSSFACLVIGFLFKTPFYWAYFNGLGICDHLQAMILHKNDELKCSASFAFFKYLKYSDESTKRLVSLNVVRILLKELSFKTRLWILHVVGALRYLGKDCDASREIVDNNGLELLSGLADDSATLVMKREIAGSFFNLTMTSNLKEQFVSSSAFGVILKLFTSTDTECARFATAALGNISEDPVTHSYILRATNIIPELIDFMTSKPLIVMREASRIISNLLSDYDAIATFIKYDGLKVLDQISIVSDKESQFHCALSLKKLASHEKMHCDLVSYGSLETMFRLIKNQNDDVDAARLVCNALHDFVSSRNIEKIILEDCDSHRFLSLLSSEDFEIRTSGAAILHRLSVSFKLRQVLLNEGVLPRLFNCIDENDNINILIHVSAILSNLSESDRGMMMIWGSEQFKEALNQLMTTDNDIICVNLARCMSFLSKSVSNHIFQDTDVIVMKTAIKMISIDRAKVTEYALMTIGNLAQDLKYQSMACNLNAVEHITILIFRNSEHLALAMWVLSRIMIPDENIQLCFNQKNLPETILSCLQAKDIYVLYNTCSVLCNISSNSLLLQFLSSSVLKALLILIQGNCTQVENQTAIAGLKALCNITAFREIRRFHITSEIMSILLMLCKSHRLNIKEIAMMALSNLSIDGFNVARICSANTVAMMCFTYLESDENSEKNVVAMNLFNLSHSEESHVFLGESTVIQCLLTLCDSEMKRSRLLAIMTLSNLSGNDSYRKNVIQNGGLKTAILLSNDLDVDCREGALILLSNLSISSATRGQAVLHGCLPSLKSALESSNKSLRRCARLAAINLVSYSKSLDTFFDQNVLRSLLNEEKEDIALVAFTFINVSISDHSYYTEYLIQIWNILTNLVESDICHFICASIATMKQLMVRGIISSHTNWKCLIHLLNKKVTIDEIHIQREIAGLFDIISKNIEQAKFVVEYSTNAIVFLSQQTDVEILTYIASTIASLAENEECRLAIPSVTLTKLSIPLLQHKSINVKREAYRAISTLSADLHVQTYFTASKISHLFSECEFNDKECEYFLSIICRTLNDFGHFNSCLSEHEMSYFYRMLGSTKEETVMNVLMVLKTLSSKSSNRLAIQNSGIVTYLSNFLASKNEDIQTLSISIFCCLSNDSALRKVIMMDERILLKTASMIRSGSSNMSSKVAELIAELIANLSEDSSIRINMVDSGVISMLSVLSRNEEIKTLRHVSQALANLALNEFRGLEIYQQGGLACILNLILTSDCSCAIFACISLNLLYTNDDVRNTIINDDDLNRIEQVVSTESTTCQFFSAMLLALTSLNIENRFQLASHLFPSILKLCLNEDLMVQRNACMALANIAESSSAQHILMEGSIVLEMACMASNIFDSMVIREWTRLFASLSINDKAKDEMLSNNVDSFLIKFARRADTAIQRYIVASFCNLCLSIKKKEVLVGNDSLLRILNFFCKSADLEVETGAILCYSALALGANKHTKEDLSGKGVFDLILDALQYPDVSMKKCASLALNILILGDVVAVKEKFHDNPRGIAIVMSLFNSEKDECVHNAMYIIGSLIEAEMLRRSILDIDSISQISRLFSSSSVQTKRSCGYVYSILSEDKEYHSLLKSTGAIQDAVNLAGMVDEECQFYGSFALFHLASNPGLQKAIAEMGAVRNLVSILATEASTHHCAGLTLLKLSENYENHIIIAEEGGINALIKLGKRKSKDGALQTKATSALSNLASETIASLPKVTPLERDKLYNIK